MTTTIETFNHIDVPDGDDGQPAATTAPPVGDGTRLYARRWLVLVIFVLLSASNAFQWIEYASIATIVSPYYGVPYLAIDWTSIVYMVNYIPLILPATWLLDRHGLRLIVLLGSFGNAVGALVKCVSARPDRFVIGFIGQVIAGSSQIFILGVPPRLAAVWFGPKEVSTACALGVFGNQLGIAAGFVLPSRLVPNTPNDTVAVTAGLERLFFSSAGVNAAVFLLVFFLFRDSPASPPSPAQQAAIEATFEKNYLRSLKQLLTNRNYLLLLITYGINVGVFYAVGTLLNQIISEYFPRQEEDAGTAGLLIVLAGMAGSVVCGVWLDRTHTYKLTTLFVYLLTTIGMVVFTFSLDLRTMWITFICSAFLGFFMTGYLPIGFEFGAELTFPVAEGTVSGLLNASAQVFGMSLTVAMGVLVHKVSAFTCNITLSICLLIGTVITGFISNDLRRQRAGTFPASKSVKDTSEMMPVSPTETFLLNDKYVED